MYLQHTACPCTQHPRTLARTHMHTTRAYHAYICTAYRSSRRRGSVHPVVPYTPPSEACERPSSSCAASPTSASMATSLPSGVRESSTLVGLTSQCSSTA